MGYSPILGRFLQRDPLGYVDDLNLFEYVRSNPPRFVDPFGFQAATTQPTTAPIYGVQGGTASPPEQVSIGGKNYTIQVTTGGTLLVNGVPAKGPGGQPLNNGIEIQLSPNCKGCNWVQTISTSGTNPDGSPLTGSYKTKLIDPTQKQLVEVGRTYGTTYLDTNYLSGSIWTTEFPDNGNFDTFDNPYPGRIDLSNKGSLTKTFEVYLICNKQVVYHVHWSETFGNGNLGGTYAKPTQGAVGPKNGPGHSVPRGVDLGTQKDIPGNIEYGD